MTQPYPTLPSITLYCPPLPYYNLLYQIIILPYLPLPYLTLPYPILPHLTPSYPTLPYITLHYPTLPYPVLITVHFKNKTKKIEKRSKLKKKPKNLL